MVSEANHLTSQVRRPDPQALPIGCQILRRAQDDKAGDGDSLF